LFDAQAVFLRKIGGELEDGPLFTNNPRKLGMPLGSLSYSDEITAWF